MPSAGGTGDRSALLSPRCCLRLRGERGGCPVVLGRLPGPCGSARVVKPLAPRARSQPLSRHHPPRSFQHQERESLRAELVPGEPRAVPSPVTTASGRTTWTKRREAASRPGSWSSHRDVGSGRCIAAPQTHSRSTCWVPGARTRPAGRPRTGHKGQSAPLPPPETDQEILGEPGAREILAMPDGRPDHFVRAAVSPFGRLWALIADRPPGQGRGAWASQEGGQDRRPLPPGVSHVGKSTGLPPSPLFLRCDSMSTRGPLSTIQKPPRPSRETAGGTMGQP